jgi:hypothetical protein
LNNPATYSASIFIKPGVYSKANTQNMMRKQRPAQESIRFVPIKQLVTQEESISTAQTATPTFTASEFLLPKKTVTTIAIPGGEKVDFLKKYVEPLKPFETVNVTEIVETKKGEKQPKITITEKKREEPFDEPCNLLPVGKREVIGEFFGHKIYREGIYPDGNCLIHSILMDIDDEYYDGNKKFRIQMTFDTRQELAATLSSKVYSKLSIAELGLQPPDPLSRRGMVEMLETDKEYLDASFYEYLSNFFEINLVIFRCSKNGSIEPYNAVKYSKNRIWAFIAYVGNIHYEPALVDFDGDLKYMIPADDDFAKILYDYFESKKID